MINLNISTLIYQPIKKVFDFVCKPENDFQWQYGTLASATLSEGTENIGTVFRSVGHLMGHRIQSTFEVTEFEPNKNTASNPFPAHCFHKPRTHLKWPKAAPKSTFRRRPMWSIFSSPMKGYWKKNEKATKGKPGNTQKPSRSKASRDGFRHRPSTIKNVNLLVRRNL
ncbi:hypothetical protein [Candidatus Villigracilis affinis]|uniref:hypothetical protein n=1 Tax=Candidatus Villigracilis affinis TaxID=3140682 RepID=UPI002A19F411|nr:hypothetical protein [Anaerolineales bacterium]